MVNVVYNFKVIAFVKAVVNGQDRFYWFILNPREDLAQFINGLLSPAEFKGNHSITRFNYQYATFHKKTKGSREMTMKANPEYLISHSLSPKHRSTYGFFHKLTKVV